MIHAYNDPLAQVQAQPKVNIQDTTDMAYIDNNGNTFSLRIYKANFSYNSHARVDASSPLAISFHMFSLIGRQNGRRIRRRRVVPLPGLPPLQLFLLLLPVQLLLPLARTICRVPQRAQREHCHYEDPERRPPDKDPSHPLNLRLGVAPQARADLVVDLLDLQGISCQLWLGSSYSRHRNMEYETAEGLRKL